MGKHYDQFDLDDRIEIFRLHADGISRRSIGRMTGRSASTVGRELRRNSLPKGGYKPASADCIAFARRRWLSRIERPSPLGDHVRDHLAMLSRFRRRSRESSSRPGRRSGSLAAASRAARLSRRSRARRNGWASLVCWGRSSRHGAR